MRAKIYFVTVTAIMFLASPLRLRGQEAAQNQQETQPPQQPQEPVLLFGGFNTEGTVSWGYRFTTIKGDRSNYNNIYNLHTGPRVTDVNLTGRAPEGSNRFADYYYLSASGLGGDPFASGQLVLRKSKLYDLRINFRQSKYDWSQNNIDDQVRAGLGVPVANGGDPTGFTKGLTANHSWETTRRMGSINLNVRATNQLQFNFEYDRNSRDGMTQTTRTLYYPGNTVNNQWGSFARSNPYIVAAPLADHEDRITGGISYSVHKWVLRYRAGYQSFSQNLSWENVASPQQSINTSTNVFTAANPNVNSITAQEKVTHASWSEARRTSTPISEFSYIGNVNPRLELHGSYNYFHFTGSADSNASFIGNARTNSAGTTFTAYGVGLDNRGDVDEPVHDVSQGFIYKIKGWWNLLADYRYTRISSDGFNDYNSFYSSGNATTPATPTEDEDSWVIGTHLVDVNMEFTPRSNLVIRPGMRYVKRDVEHFIEGISDPDRLGETVGTSSRRTKSVWPTFSVYYKPIKTFSVRADLQSITSSLPYTRVSPHTDIGTRFVFHFEPTKKISIEDNLVIRGSKFQDTKYESRYRSNATDITYNFSEKFLLTGGFTYESIFGTVSHVGTSTSYTFNGFWQDAFINRNWHGGLSIRPLNRVGIDLTGNYLRTTGASRLFSTVPTVPPAVYAPLPIVWPVNVGPLTFPVVTGTVYYDFPRAGRFSVDLQRSYYKEEIVTGNNFSANMLMLRWTKFIRPKE